MDKSNALVAFIVVDAISYGLAAQEKTATDKPTAEQIKKHIARLKHPELNERINAVTAPNLK
jgi:hypothetical protein